MRCRNAIVLAAVLIWRSAFAQSTQPDGDRPALMNVLAQVPGGNTVGGEVRESQPREDGYIHIDTPKMIARLKQLHVNTCDYLIWNSPSDWDDLRLEFLPAAQKAGIHVWVYLVPPHESVKKASFPYKMDYDAWAKALGELSKQYPALQAWQMDDFTSFVHPFTPDDIARLQEEAHAINPHLRFFPVVQFATVTEKWMQDYGPVIDGVVAPYIDMPIGDTQRTSTLDPQINGADALLKKAGKPLYVLIYVGRHLNSPLEPTLEYAQDAVTIALRAMRESRLGGIVCYGAPLEENTPMTRSNSALDGHGRLSLSSSPYQITQGDWAQASQIISIDPKAAKKWLHFWHHDGWGAGDKTGVLIKEVLLDDQVIWKSDPARDHLGTWLEGGTLEGPVDVTDIVAGKTQVKLTIRLRALQTFKSHPIDVSFDRLSGEGLTIQNAGFEQTEGWNVSDSGGSLLAAIDEFDPQTPREIFDGISKLYGDYAGQSERATR